MAMEYREVYPIEIEQGFTEENMFVMMMYDPKESRNVPIIIGPHEAEMILIERDQQGDKVKRPLTHQLICSMMEHFSLSLEKVTIDSFLEGIFYATLFVSDGFNTKKIDSRASDAIVLALHNEVPILMSDKIIEEVGFEINAEYIGADDLSQDASLDELEQLLHECEANEEYEKAAAIMERIEQLKKQQ